MKLPSPINFLALFFFKNTPVSVYKNETLNIQKKASILLNVTFFIFIITTIFVILMFVTGAIVVSIIAGGVLVFCVVVFSLIMKGKYKLAANIFLAMLFISFFSAIKFDQYINDYETYVFATLGLVLMLLSSLVGYADFQMILVTIMNTLAILALYFLDILPQSGGIVTVLHVQNLVTSEIMLIIGSMAARKLIKLQQHLLETVIKEKDKLDRMLKITEVYTKKSLIDIISNGGDPTEFTPAGRNFAVLFSDIRGFTAMSEPMAAVDTIRFLNSYFNRMNVVIQQNNGEIDKLIGDCIMASFEISSDAVVSAYNMRYALQKYNKERIAYGQKAIHTGIGICYGDVVIGNIGSESKMDYTIIGDVVNASSRLESLTKYYNVDIILSKVVRKGNLKDEDSRLLDIVRLKGKKEPIHIYEAYGHEPTEVKDMKNSNNKKINEAHELYRNGSFKEAGNIYSELISEIGSHKYFNNKCADPALNFFEQRSASLYKAKKSGFMDMDAWDGIYSFDSK
ncbi:MAG: adenylate/guanylate cyclase domain-containing protein [Spirochaetales bacterium]|nr:adenylate/guanylate cyclase domain-containing protein [Spirochaetales bacterium]